MLDRWFILLLFLNSASHYLPVGMDSSRGPEPVTKASKVSGSRKDLPPLLRQALAGPRVSTHPVPWGLGV